MSAQEYLEGLLAKYNLTDQDIDPIKRKREKIENYLKNNYKSKIHTIYYSGSYAKKTAIKLKYDLDICIYFKRDAFNSLADMYNDVFKYLKGFANVHLQTVSIGLNYDSDNIDIVPARMIDDKTKDANLYITYNDSQIKTNIPKHIDYISKSEARPIIKIMKIWKNRHGLHFKSFALELLTIKALDNCDSVDYGKRFQHVLKFIINSIMDVRLIDPANTNNNVADVIPINDKINIKNQADISYKEQSWEKLYGR